MSILRFILALLKRLLENKGSVQKEEKTKDIPLTEQIDEPKESEPIIEEEEVMDKKEIVNNSEKYPLQIQTDNERDPSITCFPTSVVNCATYAGWRFPNEQSKIGSYNQREDQFDWFLNNDPDVVAYTKSPAFKSYIANGGKPRELWDIEYYAMKKFFDNCKADLSYNLKESQIIEHLSKGPGHVILTSGVFNKLSHVISIVGYVKENDEVTHFIIDDSYGNPLEGYAHKGVGGNDVEYPKNDFLKAIVKENGRTYYGILFYPID